MKQIILLDSEVDILTELVTAERDSLIKATDDNRNIARMQLLSGIRSKLNRRGISYYITICDKGNVSNTKKLFVDDNAAAKYCEELQAMLSDSDITVFFRRE